MSMPVEYFLNQDKCSASSASEIKIRIINMLKYLKNNRKIFNKNSLMRKEFYLLFPMLERELKESFFKLIHLTGLNLKKRGNGFSSFLKEYVNLFTIVFELLGAQKMNYVIIPCLCSITSLMYFIEETFLISQDILITIFMQYSQLRLFILDNIYKTMISVSSQNLSTKYVENIGRSILLFMQCVPTVSVSFRDDQCSVNSEESHQQIQAFTVHWISRFVNEIDSKVTTNEHLPKIFNYLIRYTVKMLFSYKFPSAPFVLVATLRILMSCLTSVRTALSSKKLALEQICFIIVNLKKITNSSLEAENLEVITNIHENIKSTLEKPEKCQDAKMCMRILLIRYMEKQFNDKNSFLSPVGFFRSSFWRQIIINADKAYVESVPVAKRQLKKPLSQEDEAMNYYYGVLRTTSYDLNQSEAGITYQFLAFTGSELQSIINCYFEKIILTTGAKINSIRLSAVKQLVPLIEVNADLLCSRILRIAVRSLILDHSFYVRENILIVLAKVVLLNKTHLYSEMFEENYDNILMRLLDVNLNVQKAALNLLKNFCLKNRDDEKVLKILSRVLERVQDKDEIVKLQTAEIFRQLWFTSTLSESAVIEIIHLASENADALVRTLNYIFLTDSLNLTFTPFNLCERILEYIANNQSRSRSNKNSCSTAAIFVVKKISQHLETEKARLIAEYIKRRFIQAQKSV